MMQSLLISLLLWVWDNRSFDSISRGNRAKLEAQQAYLDKNYQSAAEHYRNVLNASLFVEPEARLNLAHAHLQLKQLPQARRYYSQLIRVNNKRLSSQAYNQLGVISAFERDTIAALDFFKKSLRQDTENQVARFNFELLKTQFSGRLSSPKSPAAAPSPAPASQNSPQVAEEVQKSEEKKKVLNRLASIKMNEAQALMILDAMKNTETQYLQQQKYRAPTDDSKGKW
ncbi:MAG: hypothetical protein MUE30_14965 [Spirosomaceae bacterium]|jgi:tetratricopeptide (TPR) repeat protein|nr:hypothetical protein [Spirosomataceae bacterium]